MAPAAAAAAAIGSSACRATSAVRPASSAISHSRHSPRRATVAAPPRRPPPASWLGGRRAPTETEGGETGQQEPEHRPQAAHKALTTARFPRLRRPGESAEPAPARPRSATVSRLPSVDPSSTTTSSAGSGSWVFRNRSTAALSVSRSLKTGMTTVMS